MNRETAVEDAVHVGSGGGAAVVAAGAVVVGEGVGDFRTVQGGSDESAVFVVGIGGRGAHPLFSFRFMCAVPVGIVGVVNGDGLIFPAGYLVEGVGGLGDDPRPHMLGHAEAIVGGVPGVAGRAVRFCSNEDLSDEAVAVVVGIGDGLVVGFSSITRLRD